MRKQCHFSNWILTSVFFLSLSAIAFGTVFSWDFCGIQDYRGLAKKPELSLPDLEKFPAQFEAYLSDHFGFRNILYYRYNKLMRGFLDRKQDIVTIGRNKWLFLTESIPDYLGFVEAKKEDLERWRLVLEGRRAWLAERGICYLFVIPPNKQTIYGEYLPEEVSTAKGETRLEKFLAYMKANSDVPILDLRTVLLQEKKNQRLYYYTDTHWNRVGRFFGYREVMSKIKDCLPDIDDPVTLDSLTFEPLPGHGDLVYLGKLDKEAYAESDQVIVPCPQDSIVEKENTDKWVVDAINRLPLSKFRSVKRLYNNKKKYRIIIFHDSFMSKTNRLFAKHFAEVDNFWFCPDYPLLKKAVESYHPDVVIDEVQERALFVLLPTDYPAWEESRRRRLSEGTVTRRLD